MDMWSAYVSLFFLRHNYKLLASELQFKNYYEFSLETLVFGSVQRCLILSINFFYIDSHFIRIALHHRVRHYPCLYLVLAVFDKHSYYHANLFAMLDMWSLKWSCRLTLQLRKMLDLLVHASQCRSSHCQYPNCRKVKGLFRHGIQCKVRASGGCVLCKKMWYLLQLHARACKVSECHVPRCRSVGFLKFH